MKNRRIKVVVCGVAGRMGSAVTDCFQAAEGVEVTYGVERKDHPDVGGNLKGVPIVGDLSSAIEDADCIVDFTGPSFTDELVKEGKARRKSLVIGTTNLSAGSMGAISDASKSIPIVLSPNMSPAMNVLLKIVPDVARTLSKGFDISIVETHHRWKKDSPSGTARKLGQILKDITNSEPQVKSLRIGGVVGEHVVTFAGEGEVLKLVHSALSRQAFAFGALLAVKFAVEANPGLYGMSDVLKMR